jgi:hypothetical protein
MVIIEVYGSNGKMIPYEKISAISNDGERIKLLIHGTFHDFSKEEILELMLLIHGKCMSGVSIDRAKVFTEMYDKLDKIYSQKE